MLTYPDIDPVAIAIGPLKVHWYGLMYLVGFAAAWMLGRRRASRQDSPWTATMVDDVIFYCVIGTIVGGRLGYMFFYGFDQILANPLNMLKIWEGGMSFHGGLIGVLVAIGLFARKQGLRFFQVADFIAPLVPPGLFAGRIGNFINGELWGPCNQRCLGHAPTLRALPEPLRQPSAGCCLEPAVTCIAALRGRARGRPIVSCTLVVFQSSETHHGSFWSVPVALWPIPLRH